MEKKNEIATMLKKFKNLDADMKYKIICEQCDCTEEEVKEVEELCSL